MLTRQIMHLGLTQSDKLSVKILKAKNKQENAIFFQITSNFPV